MKCYRLAEEKNTPFRKKPAGEEKKNQQLALKKFAQWRNELCFCRWSIDEKKELQCAIKWTQRSLCDWWKQSNKRQKSGSRSNSRETKKKFSPLKATRTKVKIVRAKKSVRIQQEKYLNGKNLQSKFVWIYSFESQRDWCVSECVCVCERIPSVTCVCVWQICVFGRSLPLPKMFRAFSFSRKIAYTNGFWNNTHISEQAHDDDDGDGGWGVRKREKNAHTSHMMLLNSPSQREVLEVFVFACLIYSM